MKTNFILLLLSICLCVHSNNFNFSTPNSTSLKAEEIKEKFKQGALGRASLAFTENKGQVRGYDGLPHPEIKYTLQQGGTQLFLLERGIAYQFTKTQYPEGYEKMMTSPDGIEDFEKMQELQKKVRIEMSRMDMTLLGANTSCKISTEGKSTDYTNFYTHDVLGVHSFKKVIYHDIYPNIDWVIYTNDGQVKYDFVVKPGADHSLIRLQFDNQESIRLNEDGSFTITNSLGSITEKKPLSFQNGKTIDTEFNLNNDVLTFQTKLYDKTQTLVIDPTLIWATYYGDTLSETGTSCATDAAGNVYLVGSVETTTGVVVNGNMTWYGLYTDVYVVKFNAAGLKQWSAYFGGAAGSDYGNSCTVDALGNIYVAGETASTVGIATSGHQNTYGGGVDAFLIKFDSVGVKQWGSYYGGPKVEYGKSCAVDALGNIYLAGITNSTIDISFAGYQNNFGGANDAYLVKFNSGGVRQWATYYGGNDVDYGRSCAVDAVGNVYLAGETKSVDGIAFSGFMNTFGGWSDAFLVKFNSTGARQWASYYGDAGYEYASSCAIDTTGNVYLAGSTNSSVNIASAGHQNNYGGSFDAFLVKFNAVGVRVWATYYGGNSDDYGNSCVADATGNIFLAGATKSTLGISSLGHQNNFGGSEDAFLAKFNSPGARQWATYFGGSASDAASSCHVDASGNIYMSGHAGSTEGIALHGHQIYNRGGNDAFLAHFCDQEICVTAGINEINENCNNCSTNLQSYISVFPNPNNGEFTIESTFEGDAIIYNTFGQIIINQKLFVGKQTLDLKNFVSGIYFLQYVHERNFKTVKIVVRE